MGSMHAGEWASMGGEMALLAHLQSNHYPPIPSFMLPIAKETISRLADGEDPTHMVTLPDGVTWRGLYAAALYALADHMHLDAFVTAEIERRIEAARKADEEMCISALIVYIAPVG